MLGIDFDAALVARTQFGFTMGFHIVLPTLTIGLGVFLVAIEARVLAVPILTIACACAGPAIRAAT